MSVFFFGSQFKASGSLQCSTQTPSCISFPNSENAGGTTGCVRVAPNRDSQDGSDALRSTVDVAGCNFIGSWLGMKVCKYLQVSHHDWRGAKPHRGSFRERSSRALESLTPFDFANCKIGIGPL